MEAVTGPIGPSTHARGRGLGVAVLGSGLIAGVFAWGLIATASGYELGTATPPLLYRWEPAAALAAAVAAPALAAAVAAALRLASAQVTPGRFVLATLGLGLVVRLALGAARDGVAGWYQVYQVPNPESASEYLPALPAFELGTRFFLDTFAEIGTALPVNAVGHPPGLLVTLHALGIDTAEGMAALTIGVGALTIPLVYVLGRQLLDEQRARLATLLYAFAPSAVLHGVTSADALYATLALLALAALVARRAVARVLGPAAFALGSFFSWANLAMGALAVLLTVRERPRRDGLDSRVLAVPPRGNVVAGSGGSSLRRALGLAAACAAALVVFYGLLHLVSGYDPLGALRSAESVYREGVASGRPYGFWVLGAPVAFLVAAGLPLAWLGLRALGRGERVALALFGVLAISAVLGFTKAETERIYLFLVPLLSLAAATVLPARQLKRVLVALVVQALATELLFSTVW